MGFIYVLILIVYARQLGEMRNAANAAKKSAEVAERTLIATQRAWISLKARVGAPLVFDQNGASTTIAFELTNVGSSPAINIVPHVWLAVMKSGGPFPLEEQTRRCNEVRQRPIGPGFVLFPGESFPASQGFAAASYGVNISQEEIVRGLQANPEGKHISLFIVGCIDYTFASDLERHHQTGFIFDLLRFLGGLPSLISPRDGQIPADNLRLLDFPLGVGRYAD